MWANLEVKFIDDNTKECLRCEVTGTGELAGAAPSLHSADIRVERSRYLYRYFAFLKLKPRRSEFALISEQDFRTPYERYTYFIFSPSGLFIFADFAFILLKLYKAISGQVITSMPIRGQFELLLYLKLGLYRP